MSRLRFLLLLGAGLVASSCAQSVDPIIVDDDSGTNPTQDGGTSCTTFCNNVCTDLKTDSQNCGKCGTVCPMGATCVQGSCQCMSGATKCGSACVDVKTDKANCGKCGTVCGGADAGPIMGGGTWDCVNGACSIVCPMPKVDCSGACVDTKTDNDNCGMCGNACMPMTEQCLQGMCCKTGEQICNNACANVQSDPMNCGMCGKACMGNDVCVSGTCQAANGTVRDVNGNVSAVMLVPCGNGTNTNCTEPVAEMSCTAIGRKLVSHASDGTNAVVSLGASTSCQWSISYFTNSSQAVAGKCLIGVSNAKWSQCCGVSSWHGNIVNIPAQLNQTFGFVNSGNSGYNAQLPNVSGTTWGCIPNGSTPPARQGCTTYYVACK